MKILLIHNYYQYWGGEDTYFDSLKEILEKKGHKVILYTKDSKDIKTIFDKIKVAIGLFWNSKTYKELSELIKKFKPDIAHFHNIYPLITPIAYWICKAHTIPIVQHIHNYRFMCPKGILFREGAICELCIGRKFPIYAIRYGCYHKSRLSSLFFSLSYYFHKLIKSSDFIDKYIFPSEFTRNYYIKQLPIEVKKSVLVPYFIEDFSSKNIFHKNLNKDYFLYVGRLSEEKGIMELVNIFKDLPKQKLIVIGDGPLKKYIKIDTHQNIEIKGFMSKMEIYSYMKNSIAVIISSLWYEVSPLVFLEALRNSKKVIVPDSDNFKNSLSKKNKLKVVFYKFRDLADLKEKIIRTRKSKDGYSYSLTHKTDPSIILVNEYQKLLHIVR